MSAKEEKVIALAQDIISLSRNTLIVNLRFMDKAISMLKLVVLEGFNNVTVDGESIGYDPVFVAKSYKKSKTIPTRQYLHMVLHCVFQHFYVSSLVNKDAWNLACDIAVENIINELNMSCVSNEKVLKQMEWLSELQENVKYMTAEVLYKYLCEKNLSADEMWKLRQLFFMDDHSIWFERELRISMSIVSTEGTLVCEDSFEKGKECNYAGENESRNNGELISGEIRKLDSTSYRSELYGGWRSISGQMLMNLETFSKLRGDKAGALIQNLNAVNREKYDYTSFLKKFSVLGEAMKVNEDEFDYIFYTYGLKMYEKMPLIEPLEYKEVKRIKEFVIAIDTSGSTSGRLVQAFIQKTYNILKQQENFFTRINLHIIQCDAVIQERVKITNQEEFDMYLRNMQIHGLGGTDFRPVFSYVDELIEKREFKNLKGMIYFTDGFGVFPQKQPEYQVAFIYVNEGYENPDVPVWAIKLILSREEIEEVTSEY